MSTAAAAPPDQEEVPAGLVGRLLGRGKKYKKAKLGEELTMYYNEELKCWLMKGEEEAKRKELAALHAPPPLAKQASLEPQQPNGEGPVGPTVGPPPMPSLGGVSKPLGVASRYAMAPAFGSTGPTAGSINSLAPPMPVFGPLKPVVATFGGGGSSAPSNIATFRPLVPVSGNPDDAAGRRKRELEEEANPEAAEDTNEQVSGHHLVEKESSDAAAASIEHAVVNTSAEERESGEMLQERASFELNVGASRPAPASPAAWPPKSPSPRGNWEPTDDSIERWRDDPIFQEILAFWSVYRTAGYSAEAMAAWTKEHYDPPQASVDYEAALALPEMHALAQDYVEQHPNISRANSPQPEGVGEPGPPGLEQQTYVHPSDQQVSSFTTDTWIPPPGDEQQQTETWHDDQQQPGFGHEPVPNEVVTSAAEQWSTVHANEVFGLPGSAEETMHNGSIGYPSEEVGNYNEGSINPEDQEDLDAGNQIPSITSSSSYVVHQSAQQTARMLRFSPVPEEEEGAEEVAGGYGHGQGGVEEVAGPSEERAMGDQPQFITESSIPQHDVPSIPQHDFETVAPLSSDGAWTGFEETQDQSSVLGFTEIVGGMVGDLFDHGAAEPLSGKLETRLAWEQDEAYDESAYDGYAEAGEQQVYQQVQEHQQLLETSSEAVQSGVGQHNYYQTTLSEAEAAYAPGTTALFSQPIIANALNWFSDQAAPGELTQHLRPLVTAAQAAEKKENDDELLPYPGDGAQLSPGRLASELGIPKSALLGPGNTASAAFVPLSDDLDSLSSHSVEEVESAAFENGNVDVEGMPVEQKEIAEEGWDDEDLDLLTSVQGQAMAAAGPATEEEWPAVVEPAPQGEGWQEFDAFPETDELPTALEPAVATVYPWSEEAHDMTTGDVDTHHDNDEESATVDETTRFSGGDDHHQEDMLIPSQEQQEQTVVAGVPGVEEEAKQVVTESIMEDTDDGVVTKHVAEQHHAISPALEEELVDLRARMAAAEETLTLERAQRASEAAAAQALAEQRSAELKSVRERLAEAREEMMEAQEDLARAQEETARVREEAAQREDRAEQELVDVRAKLEAVNAELQTTLSELRDKNQQQQQPVVPPEVEAELVAARGRIDELKETLDAERRSRQSALTAAQREAERLRDQLEDAEDEAEAARESAARRVQEALRDVRDRVRAAVEQKEADLRAFIETGTSELEAAQEAARTAEAERDDAKQESEALRSRCDELAKKFAVAKKKIAAVQLSATEARDKLTMLEGAETELANRDAEIQELRGQLQEAQELHARLAEGQAVAEEGLGRQRAEHAQEIEALEEENLKLMDMLEEKTEHAARAAEELETAALSNKSFAAELESSTAKAQALASELETVKSQLKSVQDELDDAREQLEDAATGLSDEARMEMEDELAVLKMELEGERGRTLVAEKSVHELEKELEASTGREQVLGSRLLEAQEEAERATTESARMLEAEVLDLRELVQSLRAEVESSTAATEEEVKRYKVQLIKAKKARKADVERIEELTRKCQELEEDLRKSLEEKHAREQEDDDVVIGGSSTAAVEQEEANFQLQSRVAALERELEASQQEVLEAMSVAERAVADLDEAAEQRHQVERRLAEAEAKLVAAEDKGVAANEEEAEEQLELCLASLGQEEAKVLALRQELVTRGVDEDWVDQLLARIEDEAGWGSDGLVVADEPEVGEDDHAPVDLSQGYGDHTALAEAANEVEQLPVDSFTATTSPPVDHHIAVAKDSPREYVAPTSRTVPVPDQARDQAANEGVVEVGEDTGLPHTQHNWPEKTEEPSLGSVEQGASPAAWHDEGHDAQHGDEAATSYPVWQADMHDVYQQALYATDTSDPHALFGDATGTAANTIQDNHPHEMVDAPPPLFAPTTLQPTGHLFADDGDDVAFFYDNNGAPRTTNGDADAALPEHLDGHQEELWPDHNGSQDVTVANRQEEETSTQHLTSPPSGVASATWDDFPQPAFKDPGFLEDVALGDHDNEGQFRPIPFSTQRPTSREGWSDNDDFLI